MVWDGLRLAGTLLTAVPIPGDGAARGMPDRRTAAAAMYWSPVIGLLLGAAAAGVLLACRAGHSGPLLAAVLAIALLAALTRGLHLDGLADLADGLGSRQPAGRALEIMKQSDIGPFGVATIVLTVLIQVSALARAEQIGRGPVAVVAAAVTARLAMTLACRRTVPSARPDGLGALVAGTVHPLFGGILVLAALAAAGAFGWIYPAAMAIALAVSLALTSLAKRRLGGITGDVLGAIAEVAAAACLLVAAFN
jgi:adenosylcobinamide-GDP ribazoletransferase